MASARLGGIGVYTLHCARALAEAGHEAHIVTFTLPDEIRASTPAKIIVHEVPGFAERLRAGTIAGALAAGVQAAGEGGYRLSLAAFFATKCGGFTQRLLSISSKGRSTKG